MDDTFLAQRQLDFVANGDSGKLQTREYTITRTLMLNFTSPVSDAWLFGSGAVLRSAITDGSPVLSIAVATPGAWVRRLNLLDLTIFGNGSEGAGLSIFVDGNMNALYNSSFERFAVEGVGGNGFDIRGAIFESEFRSAQAEKCSNGVYMASQGSGILSAMRWHGGGRSIRANRGAGFVLAGNAYDLHLSDTYFLLNGGPALVLGNGVRKVSDCGFENNQTVSGGPAIVGQTFGTFDGLAATPPADGGKQTSLLSFYVAPGCPLSLRDCAGGGTISGDTSKVVAENLQGVWNGIP